VQRHRFRVAVLDPRSINSRLTRRVAAIYVFLFQTLMEAQLEHDRPRVEGAIGSSKWKRETWRQVCETNAAPRQAPGGNGPAPNHSPEALFLLVPDFLRPVRTYGGLVLDA